MKKNKASNLSNQYFWKENFDDYSIDQAFAYDKKINEYPFNYYLYDTLIKSILNTTLNGTHLNILDAGGGTGKWTKYFLEQGHKVTLLDISKSMLSVAEKNIDEKYKANVEFQNGSIIKLPYKNDTFDLVFSDRNPLSHCGNASSSHAALKECFRVLKNGGIFIGSVLNKNRKIAQLVEEMEIENAINLYKTGDFLRGKDQITHYYTLSEIKNELKTNGISNYKLIPTTAFAEFIKNAWLLDEIVLNDLLTLEKITNNDSEIINYGIRIHIIAKKGE